jgi:AcrR family transcriptional regulator
MTDRRRIPPDDRRGEVLAAALTVAREGFFATMTRTDVSTVAGCSPGLVTHYFNSMDELREAVMREAIERKELRVLVQGLATGCVIALEAPDALRVKALRSLTR